MDEEKYLEQKVDELKQELEDLKEQQEADDEAIRHELEELWEVINIMQGEDPEKVGEPK